ncbi:MAG: hypothetical protein F4X82_00460 [Candidatus Spechtbacteria bacterium SB0662_bin_43]|uniref:Serine protease n=1 Tax=Candidatus Spechtbacteria bacterium SB0662_bin_43 TaxID=2604897 RepID=A0A845D8D9_9BACT|nr:hypothetical protein [Candidatus Spechtbacteria bacterium SB0662_bin_43]
MGKNQQRRIFKNTKDWQNYIQAASQQGINPSELLELRINCYKDIEKQRGRPLIVYASRFTENALPGTPNNIDIQDIRYFTDVIDSIESNVRSVDILLHSPGGDANATERIVKLLRKRFEEVHFLIPHSAYSAATLLALSGDSISMHPSATLGPVDPQVGIPSKNGMRFVPARSILDGFEKMKESFKNNGVESLPAYIPLIEDYSIDILEVCEKAEDLSRELAEKWLTDYMFKNSSNKRTSIKKIASYFGNYNIHKSHTRPLMYDDMKNVGLQVNLVENSEKDLLWEAYILIDGFFSVSPFVKLCENTYGTSVGTISSMYVQQQKESK